MFERWWGGGGSVRRSHGCCGVGDRVDGAGVVGGAGDGQAEQVAEGAQVAAVGVGFVEDAVLADAVAGGAELFADPPVGAGPGVGPVPRVDEHVRVDAGRPGVLPVIEVGVEAVAGGSASRMTRSLMCRRPSYRS